VLKHPNASEHDDYNEFSRIRKDLRLEGHQLGAEDGPLVSTSTLTTHDRSIFKLPKAATSPTARDIESEPPVSSKAMKILGLNTPLGTPITTSHILGEEKQDPTAESIQATQRIATFPSHLDPHPGDATSRQPQQARSRDGIQRGLISRATHQQDHRLLRTDGTSEEADITSKANLTEYSPTSIFRTTATVSDRSPDHRDPTIDRTSSNFKELNIQGSSHPVGSFGNHLAEEVEQHRWADELVSPAGITFANPWNNSQQPDDPSHQSASPPLGNIDARDR
jgi:hypothetical protein